MMRYKEKITNHIEYLEDKLNILLKDVQANRTNVEDTIGRLSDLIKNIEYLSNLVELEQ
jgi:hypothetical protein